MQRVLLAIFLFAVLAPCRLFAASYSASRMTEKPVRSGQSIYGKTLYCIYVGRWRAAIKAGSRYSDNLKPLFSRRYGRRGAKLLTALRTRCSRRAIPTPTATPTINNPAMDLGVGVSLNGRQVFPSDNPWNQDISNAEVDPASSAIISRIGASAPLHPDFGTVWEGAPIGIPYVVVSGTQARVPVTFLYSDESDPGPYPIPSDPPIEGGPNSSGDRHVLVIDRDNWILYETYDTRPDGHGGWICGSGAIFDLKTNTTRPAGWTSADAAGLPIFPGLVRYDEVVERGEINHALRFTVPRTRRAYVYPATHYASSDRSTDLPPMGMRMRLKASVDISGFSPRLQVILRALKRYGMMVADNGSALYLTGAPDARWDDDELHELHRIHSSDFEVIKMEGVVNG